MKITDLSVRRFRYISNTVRDSEGHGHPGPEHEAVQSVLTIHTDEGVEGYFFGSPPQALISSLVKPYIAGEDPFYRERIWHNLKERQRLNMATMSDKLLNAVDLALWDLAGRALNLPVHKLLGATRDKVPAYASTMCGDDIEGGLGTPEDYANFAEWCIERGLPCLQAAHVAAALRGGARRQTGHCGVRGCARGLRAGCPPDAGPVSLLFAPGGALPGEGPGEARLLLDGRADGRAQHVILCVAMRTDGTADLRTGDGRGQDVYAGRVDQGGRLRPGTRGRRGSRGADAVDEGRPSVRVVRDEDGGPRRRAGQFSCPVRDGYSRASITSAACCTPSSTTNSRPPGSTA